MFWKRLRIRYFIKCLLAIFKESPSKYPIPSGSVRGFKKTLLLLKLDAIGDYILFRNFLQHIRNSEQFKEYHIVLCGNQLWKDISTTYDQSVVDEFIWIEPGKLIHDKAYRSSTFKTFEKSNYDQIINCRLSRDILIDDSLIRACYAKKKTGSRGDYSNQPKWLQWFSATWYHQLINTLSYLHFEFERNKHFFEQILQTQIHEQLPSLKKLHKDILQAEPYILVFPGAGEKVKEWPPEKFASVIEFLYREYPQYNIYLCGSKGDTDKAEQIRSRLHIYKETPNLCGQHSLTDTIGLIEKAFLVICNDSSPLHIAAALKTTAVCIIDGRHYGRFAPYPKAEENGLYFVYPDELEQAKNKSDLYHTTKYFGVAPVHTIAEEKVKRALIATL